MAPVRIEHPSDCTPMIDPQGTGGDIPAAELAPKDQGTVDFVPLKPHDLPTGVYVPAVSTLDFNPFTVDYQSDEMRGILLGSQKLSVSDITAYVVNHPEYEKRLRAPQLKVLRYEDQTPVYSTEPETDAIDLIKLTDEDVAYVKAFLTLDDDIANPHARPKRQTSAYLELIRQTDMARFKRVTVDEFYKETPEERILKPDAEAMRKRFVLMKAYRALGQSFTSSFDNTISSDLAFDSMFPPDLGLWLGDTDDNLHLPLERDENSLSGAALFSEAEIADYRAKELPPLTTSEQLALAEIRQEMRRGHRNTMLALAASLLIAVGGSITAVYYALRPAASNDTNAVFSLDRPDLSRPMDGLRPSKIDLPFDPNVPKADDVLIDSSKLMEMDELIKKQRTAPLYFERLLVAGTPQTIDRSSIHPKVGQHYPNVPLSVQVRGTGTGHVVDLTDNLTNVVQVYQFGPGEIEIRGALLTVIEKTSSTRIYSSGQGPHYGILIPMNTAVNMKSIEFEGTHIVSSGNATFKATRASNAEIAALRNPRLIQRVEILYEGKEDPIVVFGYLGIKTVNGPETMSQAPDVGNILGFEKNRLKKAGREADLMSRIPD